MKRILRIGMVAVILATLGCATSSNQEDEVISDESSSDQQAPPDDSLNDFDSAGGDEFNDFQEEPEQAVAEPVPEEPAPEGLSEAPPPEEAPAEPPPTAMAEVPPPSMSEPVEITALNYRGNDNGGTLVIEGSGPLAFTTRSNPDLQQFVVEVPNSILPAKLRRNLNTKDIAGNIGSIDAYQNPGSNTSRFVIQLREGAQEPAVQAEGNSLLIVASAGNVLPLAPAVPIEEKPLSASEGGTGVNTNLADDKILSSQSLQEFLSGNQKFYGQPVSIEMDNIDVKEALRFIASESGLNMIISEDVAGKVSLKLQNVPWDQALVVLLRAKKLGYSRQGSVIRVATIAELKQEEEDATKLALSKREVESLKVRVFPVNYAKVEDLGKQIKEFLSKRGSVTADVRTASLVVTDIEEGLDKAAKLITALDTQPPQVMIEGKIVEASEQFERRVGINWGFDGIDTQLANGKNGPLTFRPGMGVTPGGTVEPGDLNFRMRLGVLDFLGSLDAALRLSELENSVKIISSPRISTLTNETAKISQVTNIPVPSVTSQAGGQIKQSADYKPLTLELEVTPQVTSDGSVMMKIQVLRDVANYGVAVAGAPAINSRVANTRVLVKNGQTAVIGGVYQSDANDVESRVPGLGGIPFLGRLFRSDTTTRNKVELLIFVTPRIIDGGTTRAQTFEAMKDTTPSTTE